MMIIPSPRHHVAALVMIAAGLVVAGMALPAQERAAVASPDGITLAELPGYATWPVIAPSQSDDAIKAILGNPAMMNAYAAGFPASSQAVPDGAVMAKVAWSRQDNPLLPGAAMVPGALRKVQFMIKDGRRFPDTDGWGYADFTWDAATGAFKAIGTGPGWAKAACHQCHTRVKSRDFVFTQYAPR